MHVWWPHEQAFSLFSFWLLTALQPTVRDQKLVAGKVGKWGTMMKHKSAQLVHVWTAWVPWKSDYIENLPTREPCSQPLPSLPLLAFRKNREGLVHNLMYKDGIEKWPKFLKQLHVQHLVSVVSYLVSSLFMLFWAPYAHIIKPFLPSSLCLHHTQVYVPGHSCFSIPQETGSLAVWEWG